MRDDIKAVIFDLDGVLCSTDQFHFTAWKIISDKYDLQFDYRINDRLRGVSRMASLDLILQNSGKAMSQEEKGRIAAEKNAVYRELLSELNPDNLLSSVKKTMNALRDSGFLLAVGSSSRNTLYILDRLGLSGYFDAVADGTDITRSKPDPEVFLKAAAKLNVDPHLCAVVEDAAAGITAAKAAGMFAIAYGGDAAGCGLEDASIESFSELIGLLL